MYGYIYKTTNLINHKIYVGQKHADEFLGQKYLGSGKVLSCAIKKYGKENFIVELLEWCSSKETLNRQERYWIKTLSSKDPKIGYNIAEGGDGGGFISHKHSEKTKQKISQSMSKYNQKYRVGKTMIEVAGQNYKNGMAGKEAKNKGKIKIYNNQLNQVKYINKDEDIRNYPGWCFGGPKTGSLNLTYLNDSNYKKQLKERFANTHFIHNDRLKLCRRIKEDLIKEFLESGWELGRKFYK